MNKKIKFILILSILILLIIIISISVKILLIKKSNEKYGNWIYDSDFLYDTAINYLKEENENSSQNRGKDDYQVFYNYHGFGIKEKDNKKYAYMYISKESYFVKHNKLRTDEKSAMLYKFTFENNEVINYIAPKDGSEYQNSVKEMFPDDIENEALNFGSEKLEYSNAVEEHYSYLDSTVAIDVDYDENMLIVLGSYGGNKPKAEANTINGKCIDGYGDIYEYQIPCNENQDILVNIDDINNNIISKYKGEKINSISEEDLKEIKNNLNNIEYSTTDITNENNQLYFLKVAKQDNSTNNTITLDYKNSDFIDLIKDSSEYRTKNTSTACQNILEILSKYSLSI